MPFMFMDRFCATSVVAKSVVRYKRPLNREFVNVSLLVEVLLLQSAVMPLHST